MVVTHEVGALADLVTRALVLGRSGHGSVLYDGPPRREELAHRHAWHHSEELAPVEVPVAPVTLLKLQSVPLFEYDFLQRALVAAAIVGLVAPLIGVFLVPAPARAPRRRAWGTSPSPASASRSSSARRPSAALVAAAVARSSSS